MKRNSLAAANMQATRHSETYFHVRYKTCRKSIMYLNNAIFVRTDVRTYASKWCSVTN